MSDFYAFLSPRLRAAFLAISDRFLGERFRARASPPFWPISAAVWLGLDSLCSSTGPSPLWAPARFCSLPRDVGALFLRQARRPRLAAQAPKLGGGTLNARRFRFLAGRDPHHLYGVADHVGGALLSARAFRHCDFQDAWLRSPLSRQFPVLEL